ALCVIQRPLLRVDLDAREETADAGERVAALRETEPRIAAAESLVEHHLLGVMRPAVLTGRWLREWIQADPDAPNLPWRAPHVGGMQPVSRNCLVCRGVLERGIVVPLEPFLLLCRREISPCVRDVKDAFHWLL